jgi:hypothetical protein
MDRKEQIDRNADPVAWARAETIAFSKRKAKRYALFLFINVIAIVLISKGMPAHALWPIAGLPLLISFGCLFAATGFYTVALLGEYTYRSKPPQ